MRWRAERPPPSRRTSSSILHAGIYVAWNGATINLKEHETLHAQWINEHHSFGHFDLTVLNASPDRVRARGTALEAEFVNP